MVNLPRNLAKIKPSQVTNPLGRGRGRGRPRWMALYLDSERSVRSFLSFPYFCGGGGAKFLAAICMPEGGAIASSWART